MQVYLWDANLRSLVGQCSLKGRQGSCIAFRGDARHLAIGTVDGCVYVFRELNDCAHLTLATAGHAFRPQYEVAAAQQGCLLPCHHVPHTRRSASKLGVTWRFVCARLRHRGRRLAAATESAGDGYLAIA